MEHQVLKPQDAGYPKRLAERLGAEAPVLYHSGPLRLLERFTLAVMASDSTPAQAMFATNQLLFVIREFGINYIGGWHSVMETEIFRIALDLRNDPQRTRSLTLFSARGLERESFNGFLGDRFGHKGPFTGFPEKDEFYRRAREGELLWLSVTDPSLRRMERANIMARNLAACALADAVFVPFAEKGTKTYTLCKRVVARGVPVFAPECEDNKDLYDLGVPGLTRASVGAFLERLGASRQAEAPFAVRTEQSATAVEPEKSAVKQSNPAQYPLFAKQK